MQFFHVYDVIRYAEDFSWAWLQFRTVSRDYFCVVKHAMLERVIEVGCGGEGEITSFMLQCMIHIDGFLPNLKKNRLECVLKIVDALCGRVAVPGRAAMNDIQDNKHIGICLGRLAARTGYRKAIDALLDCVVKGEEVRELNGCLDNTRLAVNLAEILDEGCLCGQVALELVSMVADGHRALAGFLLGRATKLGRAREVWRSLSDECGVLYLS